MNTEKLQAYNEFLANKVQLDGEGGLPITAGDLHPSLFPHQRDSIMWALRRERALVAAKFGLGKTRLSIELVRQVQQHTGQPVLIIAPLGVRHQFIKIDGAAMGVDIRYVRTDDEAANAGTPYLLTNYERVRDGNITPAFLRTVAAVALDEAAILGNLGTKTQDQFNQLLAHIPYRWVATATPAPNDYRQLIYFADFLDQLDAGQALTRWFGRNPDKAGDLQLLPHMEKDFWLWVASWALFIDTPADLGYDDTGYVMPELDIVWHRIESDHEKAWEITDQNGQAFLFKDTVAGVTQAMREKRDSLEARVGKALELAESIDDDQLVIWCNLNDEQSELERGLKQRGVSFASVQGSQSPEVQEEHLYEWLDGEKRALISKPQMLGYGVNMQQAHTAIYAGVGFKFREFIQSVHRLQRYGQQSRVTLHIIHTDAEDHVVNILLKKWQQHDEMVTRMRAIVKEFGLTNEALASGMRRSMGVTRREVKGEFYTLTNNDCTLELMAMADNSIDQIVTSIPFGNHYEYVASLNDFGHNPTDDDFWKQMDFLIPELLRVLKPGRMACIHVKDRLLYGHQTPHGMMEVDYFTHDCARAFKRHGFVSYGEIFIPTDVVRENNSTNRLGWTENCKDSSKMGVGLSEKVLLFRKPQTDKTRSYADEPVRKDKPKTWRECPKCGHKLNSLKGLEEVEVTFPAFDTVSGPATVHYGHICPECGRHVVFVEKGTGGYSRGRWQIDAHSLWRSNGQHLPSPADDPDLLTTMDGSQVYNWYKAWSKENPYDYHQHIAFNEAMGDRLPARFMLMPPQAPPEWEDFIWTDVLFFRTLNMSQAKRRVEKHICPLPLDIVERLIVRYSNPDDLILDPFNGLGTTVYQAIKLGRRGYGVELNSVYFDASQKYAYEAEVERSKPTLFGLSDVGGPVTVNTNGHHAPVPEAA